ncbi:phosphatases II [Mycena amicta]|nr:phosphatases II [Mycena amicta]
MLSFENIPREEIQAMCTPMHCILPSSSAVFTRFDSPPKSGLSEARRPSTAPTTSAEVQKGQERTRGTGALYIGSMAAVAEPDLLRDNRITHLVQVLETPWAPQPVLEDDLSGWEFQYHRIDIEDRTTAALGVHLAPACDYIERALGRGENVLVHCHQGVSRSASIVIAFLIRDHDMSYDAAYEFVRQRRSCIRPNSGFVKALHKWETACQTRKRDQKQNSS